MTAADYLSDRQVDQLLRPIAPGRVTQKQGQSHLEAYDVRAHLNRVFGFARWSAEVLDVTQLYELPRVLSNKKDGVSVAYRVTMRLTVHAPDGTVLAVYTECAAGDGVMPETSRFDAHDFAIKTAESQALKRCAINLGDQFGLSLYRKGSTKALVLATLVGGPAPEEKPEGGHESVDAAAPDVVPEEHPATEPEHAEQAAAPPPQQVGPPPTFDELLLDAEQASSTDALNSLARRAVNVHTAGHLTDQALAAIKEAVTARRTALAQPTLPTGEVA